MESFTRVCGPAVPLLMPNINTDAIAPSHWGRDHPDDLGAGLFWDWRHDAQGQASADFPLNLPRYRGARILIAGPNFACGSSRETAVWAVMGHGIRCVIAPSFGDIFPDNALQNGLLCVELPEAQVAALAAEVETMAQPVLCADLRSLTIEAGERVFAKFTIAPDRREALLEGLDQTMVLRRKEPAIAAFQADDRARRPWVYDSAPR